MPPAPIFISYVRAEASAVALRLARALERRDLRVWIDHLCLRAGDSLFEAVSLALKRCRVGVLIITESYVHRAWTKRELGALLAMEEIGEMKIFPVLHGVDAEYLKRYCPLLADRVTLSTEDGLHRVADELAKAIRAHYPSAGRVERRRREAARRPPVRTVALSYRDLLTHWEDGKEVRLIEPASRRVVVLRNHAVGITASVLRAVRDLVPRVPPAVLFFIIQFLWVVGNWVCMVLGENHAGRPLRGLCTGRRRVATRLQAACVL